MTLQLVRRWFAKLPEIERNLPIVILDGVAYTPVMILNEVERGTALGERLQALVEAGRLGSTPQELMALARARLEALLSRLPPDEPIIASLTVPPVLVTPRRLLEEVRRGSPLARQFLEAELEQARRLLRLR